MSIFAITLLKWFREHGRDLPWRQTRDPYAIWLSEAPQAKVKQGWDYWLRFMRRWPTVADLAAATEDEVLRQWQGQAGVPASTSPPYEVLPVLSTTIEGLRQLKGVDGFPAAIGSIACLRPARRRCRRQRLPRPRRLRYRHTHQHEKASTSLPPLAWKPAA